MQNSHPFLSLLCAASCCTAAGIASRTLLVAGLEVLSTDWWQASRCRKTRSLPVSMLMVLLVTRRQCFLGTRPLTSSSKVDGYAAYESADPHTQSCLSSSFLSKLLLLLDLDPRDLRQKTAALLPQSFQKGVLNGRERLTCTGLHFTHCSFEAQSQFVVHAKQTVLRLRQPHL